jgi:hypothetical protein
MASGPTNVGPFEEFFLKKASAIAGIIDLRRI